MDPEGRSNKIEEAEEEYILKLVERMKTVEKEDPFRNIMYSEVSENHRMLEPNI